ncbi:lycopene cyclase family protein [Aldersonia sp. NBC_00410]|uniref:lycopene cyclase family protein n=1 Tax=Aldersonia sp. NBC_00410 TaxID=2975954 RepID=UPI00224F91EA|nr:lycopene cyclase family protein [Aldersonia sp. NBC_00410]MCX5045139.1 lycopene cyclase family protein [Aldersonia sp. NBC_00410]
MRADVPVAPADVAIVGLGPAGRALAHRCVERGLRVAAIDPHPQRPWRATYAAWADELPAWLPPTVIASSVAPMAWTNAAHRLDRQYCVLDNAALRNATVLDGAQVIADRATELTPGLVTLGAGGTVAARIVVDARGTGAAAGAATQTAFGMVVDTATADPVLGDADALFMDWRADNGSAPDAPRSFLYAVPLGDDRVLLEETCLVGRPALELGVLRDRLRTRLSARGLTPGGDETVERVRFAVESPAGLPGVPAFGARGGLMHPCTGYSVASSLAAADLAAATIAHGDDLTAALWPLRARAVAAMRATGLRTLLTAPPEQIVPFFAAFFALPDRLQRAYLSGRLDAPGTAAAMASMLVRCPAPIRSTMLRSAFGRQNARIRSS